MHRLAAVILCILCILLPLASGQAGERVRLAVGTSGFLLTPVYLASALGRFEAQGLSVERIGTLGQGLALKALEGGQVDFAFVSGDALLGTPPGRPLVIVHAGLARPIAGWVLRAETARQRGVTSSSPLPQKIAVLRGLTLGVPANDGLAAPLAHYLAAREGWRAGESVKLALLGSGAGWIAALADGQADAGLHWTPWPGLAVARGQAIPLIDYAAGEDGDLADFLMGVLVVRAETADRQEDLVRRTVRALRQAGHWGRAESPEKVASLLEPFLGGLDAAEVLAGVKAVRPALSPHGRPTRGGFAALVRVLEAAGPVQRRAPYEALVRDRF